MKDLLEVREKIITIAKDAADKINAITEEAMKQLEPVVTELAGLPYPDQIKLVVIQEMTALFDGATKR